MTPAQRSLRDYLVVEGSVALLAAIPIAAVFAHRAYAPIAVLMVLAAATRRTAWHRLREIVSPPVTLTAPRMALVLALAGLSLWIAATGFWSPTPGAAGHALVIGVAVLAAYLVVVEISVRDARQARLLALAFAISSCAALALLFFEARTNGYLRLITPPADLSLERFKDITALGRGLAALTPSLFPAVVLTILIAAPRLRRVTLILGIAALFLVALSAALELTIAANTAAVLAGTIFAVAAWKRPRATISALTLFFLVELLLAPAFVFLPIDAIGENLAGVLPLSWIQRLYVWRHLAGEALSCLPLGCGADYARSLAAAREMFLVPGSAEALRLVPLHPHNVFLQVWLELGIPGVVLSAIATIASGRLAINAGLAPPVAAALAGAAAATLAYWSVEASIWQEWRLGSVVIAAAGMAMCGNLVRARQ